MMLTYDNSGTQIQHKQIDLGLSETTQNIIVTDANSNFFLNIDGTIAKLDHKGDQVWVTQADSHYRYQQLTLGSNGKLYAGGLYSESEFTESNNLNSIVHRYNIANPADSAGLAAKGESLPLKPQYLTANFSH